MSKPKIVFVDSGVEKDNYLLKGDTFEEIEFCGECADESFQSGHGTAIYGILRKVRESFDIISIKVRGIQNGVNGSVLCEVLEYIEKNIDASLINLSLGSTILDEKERLEAVCDRIVSNGTIIVAAFDNGGAISFPAAFKNVIGVTSGNSCRHVEDYVFYDDDVINIAGKGGIQKVMWDSPPVIMLGGNSFACAHISVLVAKLILEGYRSKEEVLAELKRRAEKVIYFKKDGKPPKMGFAIHNAAIFPFNKEMHALIRYHMLLPFSITAVYDSKYTARVGANTRFLLKDESALSLVIRNIDSIEWNEFDTLIIGHSDIMEEVTGKADYKCLLIEKAIANGKNVYAFDDISMQYNLRNVFSPHVAADNMPSSRLGMMYRITKPVLAICGTSSKQGKFTLQLELRKRFIQEGYKVGQIGTEPNALLFGMDHVFPMGYNSAVHLSEEDSILYLNTLVNDLCDRENDLIIVGSQSGTVNYDVGNLSQFCLFQHAFLLGTQPDATVLCINPFDEMDYIERTIGYIQSSIESKVIALVLYPMDISNKWSGIYGNRITVEEAKIQSLSDVIYERFHLPLYCLGREQHMIDLMNTIVDFFADD